MIKLDIGLLVEAAQSGGAIDPDQVLMQYLCTTTDGGHDPEGEPDERVRPEHAALHATIWRLDDPSPPIPPIDFGCRCSMRYVAKEGTAGGNLLGEEATTDASAEANVVAPFRTWLDENASGWESVAKAASAAQPQDRLRVAYIAAKKLDAHDPRAIARMSIVASPFQMQPFAKQMSDVLAGLGKAGRILVEKFRAGDADAAAKLARSYPATFSRLLKESGAP